MTVEALIRELQKYVPEAQVVLCVEIDKGDNGFESLTVSMDECVHTEVASIADLNTVTISALRDLSGE